MWLPLVTISPESREPSHIRGVSWDYFQKHACLMVINYCQAMLQNDENLVKNWNSLSCVVVMRIITFLYIWCKVAYQCNGEISGFLSISYIIRLKCWLHLKWFFFFNRDRKYFCFIFCIDFKYYIDFHKSYFWGYFNLKRRCMLLNILMHTYTLLIKLFYCYGLAYMHLLVVRKMHCKMVIISFYSLLIQEKIWLNE